MLTIDNKQKVIIAQRLKQLREENKLSHERLCLELKNYGLEKINTNSLKDYEVVDIYHTKFQSTKGMRIETLFALASFYGVSTDYILGISDVKSPVADVQSVCKYTGLCEESVYAINSITLDPKRKVIINDIITLLLSRLVTSLSMDITKICMHKSFLYFALNKYYIENEMDFNLENIIDIEDHIKGLDDDVKSFVFLLQDDYNDINLDYDYINFRRSSLLNKQINEIIKAILDKPIFKNDIINNSSVFERRDGKNGINFTTKE